MTTLRSFRVFLARLFPWPAAEKAAPAARPVRGRRGARRSIALFAVLMALAHAAAMVALSDSRVRDPEYGRRVARLRARVAENPGRPVVLVLGSSRAAMGVCPKDWEAARPNDPARPDPLLFNMAILGSGPVMELMALRRAYADGLRPDAVLLEYWPPFLASDNGWAEANRIATDRLLDCDRQLVRDYFPDPARIEREMDFRRTSPLFANRARLLNHLLPTWLPLVQRANTGWDDIDPWGWLPGFDLAQAEPDFQRNACTRCSDIYRPLLLTYKLSADVERALRESVALAKEHGARVGFLYLPESEGFRKVYPRRVDRLARQHLAGLGKELGVPVIDAREWMPDEAFVDGFHLSREGAPAFTRKLGPAVATAFPGGAK